MSQFLEKATGRLLLLKMSEGLLKASLLLRVMAKALDFIVIAAAVRAVPRVGFLAGLAYLLIGDGLFDGRSLGKKIMRLRVISNSSSAQGSFRDSMIRNMPFAAAMLLFNIPLAGWIFPVLILTLEFLLTLGNSEGMRLGDDLAGTKVVEG
jgi:uncharacterized RDD family membrane protein YckC